MQAQVNRTLDRENHGSLLAKDLLASLRTLYRTLQRDSNSYRAWAGLFEIFMMMDDAPRAARCLRLARRLRAGGAADTLAVN